MANNKRDDEDIYCKLEAFKAKSLPLLSPERLIMMGGIRLKTVINTLDTTTHQCIISTGLLAKQFKQANHNYDINSFLVGTVHSMLTI